MQRVLTFGLLLLVAACGSPSGREGELTAVAGSVYRPAEGAVVDLYRPGDDLRGPPFTQLGPLAADGSFSIDLPPGEYVLVARHRQSGDETGPVRDGDLKADPMRVRVEAGKPLQVSLLAYVKQGNPKESLGEDAPWKTGISGRILDPEGKPLAGLRVHVYDHVQMSERPKFVSAKTGPDGRYALALPEGGTYYVCARDKYGGPPKVGDLYGRYDRGTVDPSAVIVPEGAMVAGVDITVHTVW
ncbi:MAG: carboxypeptidase-like regulatory domain-containing protein [Thermodesulfobacteriota bacterium]|jgi:hypothetical protein